MNVIEFDHYNLRGPRELLEQLCHFYTDVVGLTNGYRPDFPFFGFWLYAGDRAVLHLSEASQDEPVPSGKASFNHAAFNCSGLEAFQKRLASRGIDYTVARVPRTNRVQLFFDDPAGNGVELNFADE